MAKHPSLLNEFATAPNKYRLLSTLAKRQPITKLPKRGQKGMPFMSPLPSLPDAARSGWRPLFAPRADMSLDIDPHPYDPYDPYIPPLSSCSKHPLTPVGRLPSTVAFLSHASAYPPLSFGPPLANHNRNNKEKNNQNNCKTNYKSGDPGLWQRDGGCVDVSSRIWRRLFLPSS